MQESRIKNKIYEKRENGSLRVATTGYGKERTQQQFKDECDVNMIIKKYKKTGIITHSNSKTGSYADMSIMPSYQEAMNVVTAAKSAFEELPAHIRAKFRNNPENMINYLKDDRNRTEAIKLGLIQERKEAEVTLKDIKTELQETRKESKKEKTKPRKEFDEE